MAVGRLIPSQKIPATHRSIGSFLEHKKRIGGKDCVCSFLSKLPTWGGYGTDLLFAQYPFIGEEEEVVISFLPISIELGVSLPNSELLGGRFPL